MIRNFTATNWNDHNFHNEISTDKIHDITFENLRINGRLITTAEQAKFKTLSGAKNIRFIVTGQEKAASGKD